MKLPVVSLRRSALLLISVLTIWVGVAFAQEKSSTPNRPAVPTAKKSPDEKKQLPHEVSANASEQAGVETKWEDKDGPEQIRKRDEWFYEQRSSANGRIPAGARLKAFQHMQRMMEAEGKLVRQSDGAYAAATPQVGPPVGGAWSSLGPTPTTGGFYSPVSGRIEAIAVDPSDPTGNTVLIGGAQGGIWRSTDGGSTWTPTGDSNPSLAMGSIAFANPSSPGGAGVVYAGTGEQASIGFDVYYGAGVLKSTDGGLHWAQTCTAASATCPFIGPYSDFTFGFYSDGGARISYVAVNPSNPSLVLVAAHIPQAGGSLTAGGVYCSDNGGATWSSIPTASGEMATFVGFANATTAYAALGRTSGSLSGAANPNGIYKSTNLNASSCTGITFKPVTPPTTQSMGRIDLGIASSDPMANTVYASIADATTNSATNLGVFVTTNGGVSWVQTAAPDICRRQCWYDNVIKVDPSNKDIVFLGGSAVTSSTAFEWVMRSTNGSSASGGAFFPAIPTSPSGGDPTLPHVDQHAMAFVKPTIGTFAGKVRLYLGNDGGLWRTDDAEALTVTWTNLNQNLTLTQFYPNLSVNPSDPTHAFGGTQDNGSQIFQGAPNWINNTKCGDGGQTAVDFQVPTSVYITCQLIRLFFSPSGGTDPNSYIPIGGGINPNGTDNVNFIPPIATDPSTPGRVYFGTDHVYQSSDNGNTFTAISGVLPTRAGNYLTAFGVSPTNASVVYAGANGGDIFVATNVTVGSASFSQVAGQSQHPFRNVTALAVDPHDQTGNTVYAAFSGFAVSGQDTLGHVFLSANGGATWTDVSCTNLGACQTPNATDLPNIPVNDLVVDPDLPGTIYAATDTGVFQGTCVGTACTWNTLGTRLPNVSVLSLKLHEPSRTMIAGTHGRGAWSLVLTNFSFPAGPHITSLSPFSAPASATSPLVLTVNGSGLMGATAVQWKAGGGTTTLTPTPISDSQVMVNVPVSLLSAGGTVQVSVSVGTANSNSLTFVVPSAAPTLASVTPSSTPAQMNPTTALPIQLIGTNFASSAKVLFNGAQRGITVASPTASCPLPTCMNATLPAALLGLPGSTDDIIVLNPPPGGGESQAQIFKVVSPPPPNDNFANAINITTLTFNDVQDSSGATTESSDPTPPCAHQYTSAQGNTGGHPNGAYNTIWYKYTPIFSANLNLDTIGSSYDTVLSIWTGSGTSEMTLTATNVACNDDIVQGVNIQSELSNVPLTAGTTYYIMVSSFGPPDPNPLALGGRSVLDFTYNNGFTPAPTLASVLPNSANSGDPDVTLTVTGSGFLSGAFAQFTSGFSGYTTTVTITTNLQTTFVSPTQLTAILPASVIALPTNGQITVSNPLPQFGGSNSLPFTVNLGTYPVPGLNSIFPTTMIAGSVPFGISANGSNFATTAVLNFNGVPKPTTVQNSQNLMATISPSDIASAGTAHVTVSNPIPGGGTSAPQPFTVAQPTVVPTISSVSPSSGPANSPISLTITGTGFLQGAFLNFAGINYSTNVSSSTQLTASIQTPVGTGSDALYVVDPAPAGTSAPFNFTVTGPPDFTITSSGTTTLTVPAGQPATFSNVLNIAPQNNFSAQVNLTCALPVAATATTCSVSPPSFPTGSGTASVMVTTMARGLVPLVWPGMRFMLRPQYLPVVFLSLLLSALLLRLARTRRQRFAGALPLAALFLFLMLQTIGCGGGSSYSSPPPPTGTPAGIYTVTVTATSGTLTHTTTLTLMVQ